MQDDDELCLCFHVTQRKVVQFIRVKKPSHVSQLSECYGAGTGCGWCRPFLKKLMMKQGSPSCDNELPQSEQYAADRENYRKKKGAS